MYDMVNFLFAKASCCSMEHRENHDSFFFGKSDFLIFQAHSFWGGGWAGLVSVVAPNSCSLYLCFNHTPSNRSQFDDRFVNTAIESASADKDIATLWLGRV